MKTESKSGPVVEDAELERLMDEFRDATQIAAEADPKCRLPCCESRREFAVSARSALRSYVSAGASNPLPE